VRQLLNKVRGDINRYQIQVADTGKKFKKVNEEMRKIGIK